MFKSLEIIKEYKRSTWRISTNNSRRKRRQCVPLDMMDDPEDIQTSNSASEWASVERRGNLIIKRGGHEYNLRERSCSL